MGKTRSGNGAIILVAWSMVGVQAVAAWPQTGTGGSGEGAQQTFEVASVRPNAPRPTTWTGALGTVRVMPGGRFVARGATLKELIHIAYALQRHDEVDSGRWSSLLDQRFHVEARSDDGDVPRSLQDVMGPMNVMLRNLLAERFRLRVRWEELEQSVLVLVRARSDGTLGAGLRASSVDCSDREASNKLQLSEADPSACTFRGANGRLQAAGHRMSEFAKYLSRRLQRPVFDRTNLEGPFIIDMTSSWEGLPSSPLVAQLAPVRTDDADTDSRPPLAMALKEQLGLVLETGKAPIRRLVIEHVEAPSPN